MCAASFFLFPETRMRLMPTARRTATLLPILLAPTAALAQAPAAWPDRPIRIIIPWAPGGSTDIVTRILGADLSKRLKQQVVIENRAGAGAIVGMEFAAGLPPDGHNYMLTSTGYGFLINKAKVDLVESFAPVAMIGTSDSALVVHPSLPVRSVKDLIALAKKRPGSIVYSSSGVGGFPHMSTELFKLMTGTDMLHVPFKGGGPAIADTAAGNTQIHLGSLPTIYGQVKAGRLRIIATGGLKRNPAFPELPTISESGVPGYQSYIWFGLFAPRATPQALVSQMHAAIGAALATPETAGRLEEQGVQLSPMSTADFARLMVAETAKWAKVIQAAKITGE
jgi:tripartite-type tricarboxylate transporter receptor subunit TctC